MCQKNLPPPLNSKLFLKAKFLREKCLALRGQAQGEEGVKKLKLILIHSKFKSVRKKKSIG